MVFIGIIFVSAFFIEAISTFVSIAGLTSFLGSSYVIVAMAISLDVAKVTTVSFLYTYWKDINRAMKLYMTVASLILMLITSVGVFGYLSAAFQTAILPAKGSDIELSALTKESKKLEARKLEIDAQIAKLPDNFVNGRTRLMNGFKEETDIINKRLNEIDKKLPEIQIKNANVQAHVGPILYVASAFNISVEDAIKYIILSIIFVFDPLAILLIISGNFLMEKYRKEKMNKVTDTKIHHLDIAPSPAPRKRKEKPTKVEIVPEVTEIVPEQPQVTQIVESTNTIADSIIDFGDTTHNNIIVTSELEEPSLDSLSEAELDSLLRESIIETEPAILKISDTASQYSGSHFDDISASAVEKADVKFKSDSSSDEWRASSEHQHFSKL